MWKTLNNVPIEDIEQFVKETASSGQLVHIGTDSLQVGKKTEFVTAIAILTPGKGGRAAYLKTKVTRITSLRERLLKEVWESVDLGLKLSPLVPGQLTIHIDANPDIRFKSSTYIQELVGLVVGQGFKYEIKPDAWAATHLSDWTVRHK